MDDRASEALAARFPPGEPRTYDAISKHGNVPLSTLHHRARGRRSKKEKAQSQQYLTPSEEKALENVFKTDVRPWKLCANKVRTLASL